MEMPKCLFDELKELGVFDTKDGSCELFFDDEGILQQVVYRLRKRRRAGEEFVVINKANATAIAHFGPDNVLNTVVYERTWKRSRHATDEGLQNI